MWWRLIAGTFITLASVNAVAEETIKVGLILPMTGPFTTTGKQVEAGARFYMQQNGASVDGKKIELILRDDAGIADNSRRIAQELLVGGKVVQAEWDQDLSPYMARTLFPLLVHSLGKRYVMLGEGTHTIIMEKNRLQLFEAVQTFLDEASRS
jgi:esterase/lipase